MKDFGIVGAFYGVIAVCFVIGAVGAALMGFGLAAGLFAPLCVP